MVISSGSVRHIRRPDKKTPVVFQNGESGKTVLRTFFVDIVMFCAQPLLRMPLALYKQEVNSGPFPADEPEFEIGRAHV